MAETMTAVLIESQKGPITERRYLWRMSCQPRMPHSSTRSRPSRMSAIARPNGEPRGELIALVRELVMARYESDHQTRALLTESLVESRLHRTYCSSRHRATVLALS